jgi:hypothetical protein
MVDTVLAQVAALKAAPIAALKLKWRELFEREPPPYNRRFLEHRLAYRIQELAYGGLKPETVKRLRDLAEELDGGDPKARRPLNTKSDLDQQPCRLTSGGRRAGGAMITDYHAKYFAHELTKRCPPDSAEKLAGAVAGAQVDLNPHQVDAALFALRTKQRRQFDRVAIDDIGQVRSHPARSVSNSSTSQPST